MEKQSIQDNDTLAAAELAKRAEDMLRHCEEGLLAYEKLCQPRLRPKNKLKTLLSYPMWFYVETLFGEQRRFNYIRLWALMELGARARALHTRLLALENGAEPKEEMH